MSPQAIEIAGALLFALAVAHTFSTRYFERLAHTRTAHAGLWHLLGEVETVFGFWALLLLAFMAVALGWSSATDYLYSRKFVEPMFVFVIMVIAGSRPIMQLASAAVGAAGRALPRAPGPAPYFRSPSRGPLPAACIAAP